MNTEKLEIYKKLVNVQFELKAPKNKTNKFGGFRYRSAEDILEAVKPILKKYNLCLITNDDLDVDKKILTTRYNLVCADTGGVVSVGASVLISEHKGMSSEQTIGAASSYARKYALNGLFSIDESENDPDSFIQEKDKSEETTEGVGFNQNKAFELEQAKKKVFQLFKECQITNVASMFEIFDKLEINKDNLNDLKMLLGSENPKAMILKAYEEIQKGGVNAKE